MLFSSSTADSTACYSCLLANIQHALSVEEMKKHVLMEPMLDLEVIDEGHFTWEIEGWRSMDRKVHSPTFQCGDYPWLVLFSVAQGSQLMVCSQADTVLSLWQRLSMCLVIP